MNRFTFAFRIRHVLFTPLSVTTGQHSSPGSPACSDWCAYKLPGDLYNYHDDTILDILFLSPAFEIEKGPIFRKWGMGDYESCIGPLEA